MDSEGACLMCSGRSFHRLGPTVEKALYPLRVDHLKIKKQIKESQNEL